MTEHDAPLTDTAMGVGAAADTELQATALRNVETPRAWAQVADDDVVDFPPAGSEALERLPMPYELEWPQSWWAAWSYAATLLSFAVVIALVVWGVWTQPPAVKASGPPPVPTTTAAAPRSPQQLIDDAFTENIGGRMILAFHMLQNKAGNFGTADQPLMQLQGDLTQREDIKRKLAALGINVATNDQGVDQGVVTGLGFDNDDAKKNWEVWYADHMPILPTVKIAPTTTNPPPVTPTSTSDERQSDADNAYIAMIEAAGIYLPDRTKAIQVGRDDVCSFLTTGKDFAGQSQQQLANAAAYAYINVQTMFPALSIAQAKTVERTAVNVYCPEFTDLVAGLH